MNTDMRDLVPLIPLPEGTHIRYTYPAGEASRGGLLARVVVTVVGWKGRPINPGQTSQGFEVLDANRVVIARISRYARVEVLP